MRRKLSPLQWGTALGFAYGLFIRLAITLDQYASQGQRTPAALASAGWVMSLSFIFLCPVGIGALTVSRLDAQALTLKRMIFTPWVPMVACLLVTAILGWEGAICIFMGSPVFFTMTSLGGLAMGLARRQATTLQCNALLAVLLLAPPLFMPVEGQYEGSLRRQTVETTIAIRSTPETVWNNIIRVPAIRPTEHRPSWFHRLGFPRPIEATLSREGVGGVRHASFEGHLVFVETVNEWQPLRSLAFSIQVTPDSIPPTTLDEHVTIGGPYFDVLEGRYEIERISPDEVLLHLSSTHRLSTHFNAYAGLWSRLVMADIQQYILEVIQRRCEQAADRRI